MVEKGQRIEAGAGPLAQLDLRPFLAQKRAAAGRVERATLRAPAAGTVEAVRGYPGMVVDPRAAIVPVVIVDVP